LFFACSMADARFTTGRPSARSGGRPRSNRSFPASRSAGSTARGGWKRPRPTSIEGFPVAEPQHDLERIDDVDLVAEASSPSSRSRFVE
jgi:hypothetical protein